MARKPTPRLAELQEQLGHTDDFIRILQQTRAELVAEIKAERLKADAEAARAQMGFATNVLARWDQGMTAAEIATALRRPKREIERTLAQWRKAQGTTVRRGRLLEERRKTRK